MAAAALDLKGVRSMRPKLRNGDRPPRRLPNAAVRSREYLTADEVERLIAAARGVGRRGHRDATLILVAYRHALRVSELVALRWDQVDLKQGLLHVGRLKHGTPYVHPIRGPEIRALRRLERDYPETPYVFVTERKGPLTPSTVRKMIARAGAVARIPFPIHPHMLRHACGYKLANDGHDTRAIQHYLGHRNITHTTRYTELAADRFKTFWRTEPVNRRCAACEYGYAADARARSRRCGCISHEQPQGVNVVASLKFGKERILGKVCPHRFDVGLRELRFDTSRRTSSLRAGEIRARRSASSATFGIGVQLGELSLGVE